MEMSIRKKARIAWEDSREVEVRYKSGTVLQGFVRELSAERFEIQYRNESGPSTPEYDCINSIRFVDEGEGATTHTRTVYKETLDFLRGQVAWNAEGKRIKTEYVYNLIDDLEKALDPIG